MTEMDVSSDERTYRRKSSGWWKFSIIVGVIPLTVVLTDAIGLPLEIAVIIVMVAVLVSGTMAIWLHAAAQGDGWWQDDSCSGWRGY